MTRAVVAGDLHLFHGGTEVEAIEQFIGSLERDPPDLLVLGGDIYELWRRDLSGVTWSASEYTSRFKDLEERGVKVVLLVGNHDSYILRHLDMSAGYPFEPQLDFETTLDGQDIFVTHGHKYEPQYAPPVDDALALTDDHAGGLIDFIWENRPAPGNPLETAGLAALGPAASYLDPESLSKNGLRKLPIEEGIMFESGEDEWGIYGHTHEPFVDRERKIANWGSMTAGQATYLEIVDGVPELRRV